ncbi:2-dehydropantoate 2-reductase [Caldibacillus lycopersici]|uniref:2-dehydropantoate 2-reductase n=1 Tax=Perspicuibacillus lycopersici TaxID=1325689 RepID=A0AAE3IT18_9BACI|nr:2-dehydropantoate 2-reductase [Perspicuibacillus lycopersici]MCU9612209.1 2-dehydropantoate 2-reductase [Perspicuibacillus lycopersici]
MKIGIIGGGSIGLLFSCYLSENHQVTLYCRTINQVNMINQCGITLQKKDSSILSNIHAKLSTERVADELVLVTVKQYHLPELLPILDKIPQHIPLLFLQNGMGHLDYLQKMKHDNILLGVVEHGALKISLSTVKHTGFGTTRVAAYKGDMQKLMAIKNTLQMSNFPFEIEANYNEMLIRKLVVNAAINPLTALLRIKNGDLLSNNYYFELLKEVFQEIIQVLCLQELEDTYFASIVSICQSTSNNYSSMLKDILEHRQTEIEGIVGVLRNKAEIQKQSVPFLQFLYTSIKGMEYKRWDE